MDHNPTVFTVSLLNLLSEFDNIEDTLNESFNENKVIKKRIFIPNKLINIIL